MSNTNALNDALAAVGSTLIAVTIGPDLYGTVLAYNGREQVCWYFGPTLGLRWGIYGTDAAANAYAHRSAKVIATFGA